MYGLLEPIAFAIHLEDVAMMRQTVQQCSCHPFSLKDLHPFAKRKVAGNQQGDPFAVQRLLGHADLQMATRYVQDVSAQTDRVIENSRMYVCQIKS